jgi:UDP-glucose 4-epimerase
MATLITGGAGFIGSHLTDHLLKNDENVKIIDDLSAGSLTNLNKWVDSDNLIFIKGNILHIETLKKGLEGCEKVIHAAANPEVRDYKASPKDHFEQNITGTYALLEAVRKYGEADTFAFTSTSTVYGEPETIPTREFYGPMKPISLYGASKLACEALISSYANMYGFRAVIYRLANIIGPRSNHGVIFDFVQKLRANPKKLEVLGDGTQSKSYLYISDCVTGIIEGLKSVETVEIFNLGSEDRVSVIRIAEIVAEEMGIEKMEISLTGGVDGGRGWKGDVKLMQLSVSKFREYGWGPQYGSEDAVRLTARALAS